MFAYTRLEVAALPLAPSVRNKLQAVGFRTTADLHGVEPLDLANEANITHEEALFALKVALPNADNNTCLAGAKSARQLFDKERSAIKIITFSAEMDKILGGGVPVGQVTEFCGVPGVGKTQLGMQLAINVQLATAFRGLGGAAVYIDTEGSFAAERCAQMARAFCGHLRKIAAQRNDPARIEAANATTEQSLLSNIHVFRARDHVEQLAIVDALPAFLDTHLSVRLIVIDSVTFHFRQDFADMGARTRQLTQMAQSLMHLAGQRDLAVVLMNQVTTKLAASNLNNPSSGNTTKNADGGTRLVPALGDSWAHAATNRIILYWQEGVRHAFIYKSPTQPATAAEYGVTADGIRSVNSSRKSSAAKRPHPG